MAASATSTTSARGMRAARACRAPTRSAAQRARPARHGPRPARRPRPRPARRRPRAQASAAASRATAASGWPTSASSVARFRGVVHTWVQWPDRRHAAQQRAVALEGGVDAAGGAPQPHQADRGHAVDERGARPTGPARSPRRTARRRGRGRSRPPSRPPCRRRTPGGRAPAAVAGARVRPLEQGPGAVAVAAVVRREGGRAEQPGAVRLVLVGRPPPTGRPPRAGRRGTARSRRARCGPAATPRAWAPPAIAAVGQDVDRSMSPEQPGRAGCRRQRRRSAGDGPPAGGRRPARGPTSARRGRSR